MDRRSLEVTGQSNVHNQFMQELVTTLISETQMQQVFGERFKELTDYLKTEHSLSHNRLAKKLCLTGYTYKGYRMSKFFPKTRTLYILANLGISVSWLFGSDEVSMINPYFEDWITEYLSSPIEKPYLQILKKNPNPHFKDVLSAVNFNCHRLKYEHTKESIRLRLAVLFDIFRKSGKVKPIDIQQALRLSGSLANYESGIPIPSYALFRMVHLFKINVDSILTGRGKTFINRTELTKELNDNYFIVP